MHRVLLPAILLAGFAVTAQASDPFSGWGFWQPYGIRTETLVPTPPYFSIHPPVYYGQRYSRPYGVSPFAALPQVGVPGSYQAQIQTQNAPIHQNPHCAVIESAPADSMVAPVVADVGPIITNPFFESPIRLSSDSGKSL